MKKIVFVMLVVLAFTWISIVSAGNWPNKRANWPVKESPESIVTCLSGAELLVLSRSVHGTINLEQCKVWPADPIDECSPCITSLEGQGCKIVDVGMTSPPDVAVAVTYLLSCDGR
jgi:hypothetical protein